MALPSSYLTSTKNLSGILNSIVSAQAPEKFTTRFLESLDYKANADRLVIGLLKSLKFLEDDGRPTQRYFEYLDQSKSTGFTPILRTLLKRLLLTITEVFYAKQKKVFQRV